MAYEAASFGIADASSLVNLCADLFILPFFFFSATAGQLADKYEKSRLIRYIKLFEVVIMLVGAAGFYYHNLTFLLAALFLMGAHSTLFGPVKYAILPQHLRSEEIVGGNGLVETGTSIAILVGTILGGVLMGWQHVGHEVVAATVIVIACLGLIASFSIPNSPAAEPTLKVNWNVFTETWRNFQFARSNRTVFLSILGISWFWFYGATFLSQLPSLTKQVIGGNEHVVTLLLAVFSIGIGLGSLLCERLSGRKVELGLVPFGSIGLSVFGIDFYFALSAWHAEHLVGVSAMVQQTGGWPILIDLLLIGLFGGFYIVPLYALVQIRSEIEHRSRIIAGNNILNALFMVFAAALAIGLLKLGLTIPQLLLVTVILNIFVAAYIYTLLPEFLMRFIVWLLVHSIYRLNKRDLDRIPEKGPALLVCNHVSFVDALVIAAACRRPIRFVMDHRIFKIPILNFVFRTSRCIPIAPAKEDPALLERAYDEVAAALEAGNLVGIFPEGKITDTSDLNPFRSGVKRIIDRTPVPIIPLALRGLWGSFFSRRGGKVMSRLPTKIFYKIELAAAPAILPTNVNPDELQHVVAILRGDWK